MSLFFRPEKRASGTWPTQLIPSRMTSNGVPVTADAAAGVVAFGAAVHMQASIVAMLPVDCFTGRGENQRPAVRPALLTDPGGRGYGWGDWLYQAMVSGGFRGNAVGRVVERDGNGIPSTIVLADMDTVNVDRDRSGAAVVWRIGNEEVDRRDVWHLRRYPRAGQILGMSPIQQYASTLGLALSSERFGADWFTEGAHPSGILTTDQSVPQDAAAAIKKRFMEAVRGNREPAVLGQGVKYAPIQISPEESQFLATQQFSAAQAARIVGAGFAEILGYAVGDSMTYKNIEQTGIHLLTYAIDPWLTRLEESLSALLPRPQFVKFNRAALLRTDLVTRYTAYRTALGPSEPFTTVNEVRALEDAPPVAWGDEKPQPTATPVAPTEGPTP